MFIIISYNGLFADQSERFTDDVATSFPTNTLIIKKHLVLDKKTHQTLQTSVQDLVPSSFTLYTGFKDDEIIGFAVLDTKTIQYHPITFLSRLDKDGTFISLTVLDHQGVVGLSTWSPHLLNQFIGKSILDELQLENVDVITGATATSRTAVLVVRRALFVADFYIKNYIKKD
jgi:Na+-translocating ferredoxin:NAD+ oxidoreductase RnfG subunit